jgi:hypothetical protein
MRTTPPGISRPKYRTKSVTFTGASGLGANGTTTTFFTITGAVHIEHILPYVVTTLTQSAGTPNIALGVTNSTSLFIAATTATALTTGEFWTENTGGNTPDSGVAVPAALKEIAISSNIIVTVGGTNNVNGGVLRIDLYWWPLSLGATVV